MNQLRVAVIGAGHLGRIHAKLLPDVENTKLVAIVDPSPAVQQEMIQSTHVKVVSDYTKIIDEVDAAVIATPTRSHFEIADDLLSRKIHTLIEKPITDCPYRANRLVRLAEEQECVLSVGHVEQFNPAIRAAMDKIGSPKFIQSSRTSGYTFRSTDIGVVHDLMIHDIDLVNSLFPGNFMRCMSSGFSAFGGNEDLAQARLEFDCGGVANLTASRCSFSGERKISIFGTDGFASVDLATHSLQTIEFPDWLKNRHVDMLSLTPEQKSFVRENLFESILPLETTTPPKANAILEEQKDWVHSILSGAKPRNTGENAAAAVSIAQQILDQIDIHCWDRHSDATGPLAVFQPNVSPIPHDVPAQLLDERKRAA